MTYREIFEELPMSVLVFKTHGDPAITYMNRRARMLLMPSYSVDNLIGKESKPEDLRELLKFNKKSEYELLRQTALNIGSVENFRSQLISADGSTISVSMSGSNTLDGEEFLLYIYEDRSDTQTLFENQLMNIVNTVFISGDVEGSINRIMAISGETAKVSRVYVFEEISDIMTRNTYEWCAEGIEPAIQELQNLPKADYNYDVIVNSGMYIVRDVSTLPDKDRQILEMQGIKALALLSIYDNGTPIGYVGFDDCETTRNWDYAELSYLKSIASMLYMLIKRRKIEANLQYYASTDTMTGIVNRKWGAQKLEELLNSNTGGTLCFIDIDGLKYSNDNFGHVAGDELLRTIVEMIKDGISQESFICRWGGDEFLVWLNQDMQETEKSIKQIQHNMDLKNQDMDKPYKLAFSYGLVQFKGGSLDELISQADELMYKNKMDKRGLQRRKTDIRENGQWKK